MLHKEDSRGEAVHLDLFFVFSRFPDEGIDRSSWGFDFRGVPTISLETRAA